MGRSRAAPIAGILAASGALVVRAIASQVVRVRTSRRLPHHLLEVGATTVVLRRDEETLRPGAYGIYWRGGRAVIGEVLEQEGDQVVRELLRVDAGELSPGRFDFGHLYEGDPKTALDLAFTEHRLDTEVGEMPVWEIAGREDLWVIVLHGYRGSRQSALEYLPVLHSLDLSVLVLSYRNDPDAPAGRDRRYHLGVSEWREVEAAVARARAAGARRVVLFGWSMGAAIALQAYANMAGRELVVGLLLDSPVLDWRAVLRHQARRAHVPQVVMSLALRRIRAMIGLDYRRFDWVARADELAVPVLIFHSSGDPTVPVGESRALARRRPDLVTLVDAQVAGHVGTLNVDPRSYEDTVAEFLAGVFELERGASAEVLTPVDGNGRSIAVTGTDSP